ncbi:MAG: hypothetical protein MJ186_04540 [Clostridia bacterium]|nr:hypothetical protein [Clostridia bacterium]
MKLTEEALKAVKDADTGYVKPIDYAYASAEEKARIDEEMKGNGRLTNMKLTLLKNTPSFRAMMCWYRLEEQLLPIIGERALNFFCYAISTENDCLICSMFFTEILKEQGLDFDTFEFTEQENALIALGRGMVTNANEIQPEVFENLRKFWTEEEIVLIVTFATQMYATNLFNKTLQVPLDERLLKYTEM